MRAQPSTLLLRNTNSPTSPSGRLRVLSPHSETPVVSQTTVSPDLLQPLEIFTEFAVHVVGQHLAVLSVHDVALSVEEPGRDLVLCRILDNSDDALEFLGGEFTSTGRGSVSALVL